MQLQERWRVLKNRGWLNLRVQPPGRQQSIMMELSQPDMMTAAQAAAEPAIPIFYAEADIPPHPKHCHVQPVDWDMHQAATPNEPHAVFKPERQGSAAYTLFMALHDRCRTQGHALVLHVMGLRFAASLQLLLVPVLRFGAKLFDGHFLPIDFISQPDLRHLLRDSKGMVPGGGLRHDYGVSADEADSAKAPAAVPALSAAVRHVPVPPWQEHLGIMCISKRRRTHLQHLSDWRKDVWTKLPKVDGMGVPLAEPNLEAHVHLSDVQPLGFQYVMANHSLAPSDNKDVSTELHIHPADFLQPCECSADDCGGLELRQQVHQSRLHGFPVKVVLRRAGDFGLGLFAGDDIAEGDYVMEYLGDVLEVLQGSTNKEVAAREAAYQRVGWHYMFDMQQCYDDAVKEEQQRKKKDSRKVGKEQSKRYIIDATLLGNAARFINHSCSPNLRAMNVCQGRTCPGAYEAAMLVALVADRDIEEGEELTMLYNHLKLPNPLLPEHIAEPCMCGADNCRKVLWLTPAGYQAAFLSSSCDFAAIDTKAAATEISCNGRHSSAGAAPCGSGRQSNSSPPKHVSGRQDGVSGGSAGAVAWLQPSNQHSSFPAAPSSSSGDPALAMERGSGTGVASAPTGVRGFRVKLPSKGSLKDNRLAGQDKVNMQAMHGALLPGQGALLSGLSLQLSGLPDTGLLRQQSSLQLSSVQLTGRQLSGTAHVELEPACRQSLSGMQQPGVHDVSFALTVAGQQMNCLHQPFGVRVQGLKGKGLQQEQSRTAKPLMQATGSEAPSSHSPHYEGVSSRSTSQLAHADLSDTGEAQHRLGPRLKRKHPATISINSHLQSRPAQQSAQVPLHIGGTSVVTGAPAHIRAPSVQPATSSMAEPVSQASAGTVGGAPPHSPPPPPSPVFIAHGGYAWQSTQQAFHHQDQRHLLGHHKGSTAAEPHRATTSVVDFAGGGAAVA